MAKPGAAPMDIALFRDIAVIAILAAYPAWVAVRPDPA
jgi:hypothetical protein